MDYLGLDRKKVDKVAKSLNELLAAYQLHYQKLRNFHWNLKSNHFFVLHDKFEEFYTDANDKIDDIAERILTLGVQPLSQMSDYLRVSRIHEVGEDLEDDEMVKEVLSDYKELIAIGREVLEVAGDANDEGTIDLIAGYVGDLEKNSWMLASYLEKHNPEIPNTKRAKSKNDKAKEKV